MVGRNRVRQFIGLFPFFARGQEINGDEPLAKRDFAFPEDRADLYGEILLAGSASVAIAFTESVYGSILTVRAVVAIPKAYLLEVFLTGFFILKVISKLY